MMDFPAWFLSGQIFFALAIALYVQSRRYSRLALSRALPWLAAFSFFNTVYAWGRAFPPPLSLSLVWNLATGLAFGWAYLSLFCAANQLWPSEHRLAPRWCHRALLFLATAWALLTVAQILEDASLRPLVRFGILFLALPAVVATAYTLRKHAQAYILPLQSARIYRTLQVGGIAFFFFGLLLLLEVAPETWQEQLPISPAALQLGPLVLFVWGMLRGLDIFEVETRRRLEAEELAHVQRLEREQVARELHDGAIQHIYAASLWLQHLDRKLPESLRPYLRRAEEGLKLALQQLRAFLRQTDQSPDDTLEIHRALTALVEEARRISGADIVLHAEPVPPWEASRALHLIFFAREALANAIRHAQSPTIEVRLHRANDHVRLEVVDQGRGMPHEVTPGFGLKNMQERALLLGGRMEIESEPGRGTRVVLTVPLPPS